MNGQNEFVLSINNIRTLLSDTKQQIPIRCLKLMVEQGSAYINGTWTQLLTALAYSLHNKHYLFYSSSCFHFQNMFCPPNLCNSLFKFWN